jgi:DNA-directed RNA polymerase specialized sigma subunit
MDLNRPLLEDLTDKERRVLGKIFDDIRNQKKIAERRAELTNMIRNRCDAAGAS